jgi:very-short-patch-repair endonuclease
MSGIIWKGKGNTCFNCSSICSISYVVLGGKILCLDCYDGNKKFKKKNDTNAYKDKQRKASAYSKELKRKKTDSERKFERILNKTGFKYSCQRSFIAGDSFYICDYVLSEPVSIVFEIDGGYHNTIGQKYKDQKKDEYLRGRKFNVVRITNQRVDTLTVEELKQIIEKNNRKGGLQKFETDRY